MNPTKGQQGFQKTHGMCDHPLYKTWKRMKNRCYNSSCKDYKDYGARGITMCESWKNGFLSFYVWALQSGWKEGLSIEREDVNLGYCAENCKWIPVNEQPKNRRGVMKITHNGETHTIPEWAEKLGISRRTLSARINSKNFTIEQALEMPVNKKLARRGNAAPYREDGDSDDT